MANPIAEVEDFAATLSEELNFVNEARSMELFAANLAAFGTNDHVRVPTVRWAFGFLFQGLEEHAVGEDAVAVDAEAFAATVQRGAVAAY
jgi:hypothetical protein